MINESGDSDDTMTSNQRGPPADCAADIDMRDEPTISPETKSN